MADLEQCSIAVKKGDKDPDKNMVIFYGIYLFGSNLDHSGGIVNGFCPCTSVFDGV